MNQGSNATARRRPAVRGLARVQPAGVYGWGGRLPQWFAGASLALAAVGLVLGLLMAPPDPVQGDAARILLLHVPACCAALGIYLMMVVLVGAAHLLRTPLAPLFAAALAPTGALMSFFALWTGALWRKPTVGSWWTWSAPFGMLLPLLFLFLGFMALQGLLDESRRADRAGAMLVVTALVPLAGLVLQAPSVPHPDAGVLLLGAPAGIEGPIAIASRWMTAAFCAYVCAVVLHRVCSVILEREKSAGWVRELPEFGR